MLSDGSVAAATSNWVDVVQAIAAIAAAGAVILGAIVAARLSSRHQSRSWVREQRSAAYDSFYRAVAECLTAVTNGARPDQVFGGIEPLNSRSGHVIIFGGDLVPPAVGNLLEVWTAMLNGVMPLGGDRSLGARAQRAMFVDYMVVLQRDLVMRMRLDLGVASRSQIRNFKNRGLPVTIHDVSAHISELERLPRTTLAIWDVHVWTASGARQLSGPGDSYVRSDRPWESSIGQVQVPEPIAAWIRLGQGLGWMLAIDDRLTDEEVSAVELEAVRLITHAEHAALSRSRFVLVSEGAHGQMLLYLPMRLVPVH